MKKPYKIGLGGGCHWCTEGVFQSLLGVNDVQQGWISSNNENKTFSEAVVVDYSPAVISLKDLIEIHLFTHASTSNHSFREKYRSAIYVFDEKQKKDCKNIITNLQNVFDKKIITEVLDYSDFKLNEEEQLNYLYTRKDNAFCEKYIHPKLAFLIEKYEDKVNIEKVKKIL